MMLVLTLAMLSAQTLPSGAETAQEPDIIIIARRAKGVRWDWRVNKSGVVTKCVITRSSGDGEIDRIGCDATRLCAAKGLRSGRTMTACIVTERRGLIEQLAARREARAS